MAPSDIYSALVLQSSPRGYWKMDELSGLQQDSSGNGNHMTSNAATQYRQAGPYGNAYSILFNAAQGCSRPNVTSALADFTWEAWVQFVSVSGDSDEIFRNSGTGGWAIWMNTNLKIQGNAQGVGSLSQSNTAMSLLTWYHLAVLREGGVWKYYRNGVIETPNAGTTLPTGTANNTAINPGDFTKAFYSNVAIYATALAESTVLSHYYAMARVPGIDLRPIPTRGRGA